MSSSLKRKTIRCILTTGSPLASTSLYQSLCSCTLEMSPTVTKCTSFRLFTSILVCSGTFVVSYTSAAFNPAIDAASLHFHVGAEITTLATSLYILGFATGPILWAPLSELCKYGRLKCCVDGLEPIDTSYFLFLISYLVLLLARQLSTAADNSTFRWSPMAPHECHDARWSLHCRFGNGE